MGLRELLQYAGGPDTADERCSFRALAAVILLVSARATRMYFPLLLTNGSDRATIECRGDGFAVRLGGCAYSIKSKEPDAVTARILDVEAPNRNGIYKVGLLEKKGDSIGCEIRLTQVSPAE